MSKRPNPKIFLMMTVGMVVLGGAGGYYFYNALTEEQDHVAALTKEARDVKDVQAELAAAQIKLKDCQALLTHLEMGVPDQAFVPTMLAELEKTGIQNGIKVTGVKPIFKPAPVRKDGDTTERKAYQELTIEVKGTGKYADVRRFVSAMNVFPKIVAAHSVALTPKSIPGQDWSDNLEVTVELKAFVFPSKDDTQPAAAATDGSVALSDPGTPATGAALPKPGAAPAKALAKTGPTASVTVDKPVKEVKTGGR